MATNYAYYYARIDDLTTGFCMGVLDSSYYVLDPTYVPIEEFDYGYVMRYYWPIPTTVTSHEDFQGQWYEDAAHTIPWSLA